MAEVIDLAYCLMWAPHSRFRFARTTEFRFSDTPWQSPIQKLRGNGGVFVDPDARALLPSAFSVPHNQRLAASEDAGFDTELAAAASHSGYETGLPWQEWTIAADSDMDAQFRPAWGGSTERPLPLCVLPSSYSDADTGQVALEADVDSQAWSVRIDVRPQPAKHLASAPAGGTSATPSRPCYVSVMAKVGETWYRVRYKAGGTYEIARKVDGTWKLLTGAPRSTDKKGAGASSWVAGADETALDVEFRILAGRMIVRVGTHRESYAFAETSDWRFSGVRIEAQKFLGLEISSRPIWWRRTSYIEGGPEPIGFTSDSFRGLEARWSDDNAPGWTLTLDEAESSTTGPTLEYKATLEGQLDGAYQGEEYSRLVRPLRSLDFVWDAEVDYTPAGPVQPLPSSIAIAHVFNPQTLRISSSASLTFNAGNLQLLPTGETGGWAQWSLSYGQVALEIWGTRGTPAGAPPPVRLFTGYGHVAGEVYAEQGGASFVMSAAGRSVQLRSTRWNLPPMDGWNVYYAMYFLANLSGWAKEEMAFASSIPIGPFDDSLDEDGEPAWFLPVGAGGAWLTQWSGQQIEPIMAAIAYAGGYMLYDDLEGKLQLRKFRGATSIARRFYESDPESGGFEGCWSISFTKDMSQVRSSTSLIGPDPETNLATIATGTDEGVMSNPSAFNHLGYPCPAAWMDLFFLDPEFAQDSVDRLHPILRTPGLDVQLTTWFQPDLYPLDGIELWAPRLGFHGLQLAVMGVFHSVQKGTPASTRIVARYFPNA